MVYWQKGEAINISHNCQFDTSDGVKLLFNKIYKIAVNVKSNIAKNRIKQSCDFILLI